MSDPTAAGEPAKVLADGIGVQLFEADIAAGVVPRLQRIGVEWVRTRALWKLIEPRRVEAPHYDWTVTDSFFGAVARAKLNNLVTVYANPPWAADTECGPVREAETPRWGAFWRALVERYDGDGVDDAPGSPRVPLWEVSNEPDFDPTAAGGEADYGGCFGDAPEAYARQLEVAYRAAKSADPSTTVVFGAVAYDRYTSATAPAGWKAPPGPFNGHFTREVLADLEGREGGPVRPRPFDAVSVHNYNDNAHFWDGGGRREVVARLSAFRRDELDAGGVSPVVPVIVSEAGLATSPSDQWTERNPSHQAAYLVQTMIRGVAAGAELTVWYTARDNLTGDCAPPHYDWLTFGLMPSEQVAAALAACPGQNWAPEYVDSSADPDAALRPAFTALSVLLDVAGRSTYDRNLTAEETGDGQIEAYRLRDGQNRAYLVAWAEGGNRLGARSEAPPEGNLRLDANVIPEWTGVVSRIDAFGVPSRLGRPGGESVTLTVGETPVYLTAAR